MLVYVDSSALVKLVVEEEESTALRWYLSDRSMLISSRLAEVEISRAVRRRSLDGVVDTDALFARIGFCELDAAVARMAAELRPAELRTLDAIHLASALVLGEDLDSFLTYDSRLAGAARSHGLTVASPA